MENTTNYQLPKYAGTDPVNLLTGYNAAMDKIDTQMKANATAASAAQSKADQATSTATAAQSKADEAASTAATAKSTADTAKQTAEDALAAAGEGGAFNPSAGDAVLSVSQLSTVKVASNGIVYVPQD